MQANVAKAHAQLCVSQVLVCVCASALTIIALISPVKP